MEVETAQTIEAWVRDLPSSRMMYPAQLHNRAKYYFWHVYTPYHPIVRDTALRIGLVRHEGRQDFLIGRIAPGITMREFIAHCIELGFGNHFVAWHDEGELVSLRLVEDFARQYHLRVFEDGEIRGHYEYTPECYPRLHMLEVGLEDRREVFYDYLGNRIIRFE